MKYCGQDREEEITRLYDLSITGDDLASELRAYADSLRDESAPDAAHEVGAMARKVELYAMLFSEAAAILDEFGEAP